MNYLRHSARSLFELLNNQTLYIFAFNEDAANKELNVHLFVIDKDSQEKAKHYRRKIEQSYAELHGWLSEEDGQKSSVYTPTELKLLVDIDFGTKPSIVHHLWSKDRIVGGFSYEYDGDMSPPQQVTPVLDVLTIQLCQRQEHIELEKQIETYKHVLDLVPQRIFWKNKQSVYLGANKAFSLDAGLTKTSDIVGSTDFEHFPQEAELYRSDDQRTMQTRQHILNIEEPQTTKSGDKIWLKTSKRPMVNSQNEVIGVLATYDEITELKNVQFELQESKDKLEERVKERTKDLITSNNKLEVTLTELKQTQNHLVETEKMAALGNLVAGISHEVNTPIGVSVTAASHLQENIEKLESTFQSAELTEQHFNNFCLTAKNSAQMLLSNLTRASELIKNFKQIAVDQSNDVPRKVILKDYVISVLSTLSPAFRNKKIELIIDIDREFELIIYPGAFAQIISNFTENTIKHAFPEENAVGKFRISCDMQNENINILFTDDGVGMPLSIQKQIFEPFFTTCRSKGGSGLGLSIIYNIVCQQFGGTLECKSELGKGSEFLIQIPSKSNAI
jgi:two-component system autoinducer 2 sensor kinase/phosphatase LuxQ